MSDTALQSIRLQNFKRHEDLELDFSENLTVIRGPNYAGKSTVLEAVFFALFGTKAVPGGAEVITRTGSKTKACVTLSLKLAGEDFVVIRTPTSATLTRGDETIATGHTAVNEEIASKFGGDMKRTMMLAFSSQGETSALLTMGAAKLNTIIEDVSGVDYIDKLIERASKKETEAKVKLDAMEEVENIEELEQAEAAVISEASELKENKEAVSQKLTAAKQALDKSKSDIEQAQENNKKAERNNRKRDELRIAKEAVEVSLRRHAEQLKGISTEGAKPEEIKQDKDQANSSLEEMVKSKERLLSLQHKLDAQNEWKTSIGANYIKQSDHLHKADELRAIVKSLEQTREVLMKVWSEARNEYQQLKRSKTDSVCSTCNRPFDDSHLAEIEAKLPAAKKAFDECQEGLDGNGTKLDETKAQLRKIERDLPPSDWKEQIQTNSENIKTLKAKIESIEFDQEEYEKLMLFADSLSDKYADALSRSREYARLEQTIEQETVELDKLSNELSLTKELVMTSLDSLLDQQGRCFEKAAGLAEEKSALEARLATLEGQQIGMALRLKKARRLAEARAECETAKARFGGFARWLRSNKAAFLAEVWAGILALVSEFVCNVTSGRVEEIGRDPDGDFWFREGDQARPILAASGGQRSIMGAGLRLALSSLLPTGLGFVVLDEPSADLNTEHAAALAGALRASNRQVILVTHREGEEFSSDAVVVLE